MHRLVIRFALLPALALPLVACEGVTGPAPSGETTVVLRQSVSAGTALSPSYSAALSSAVSAAVAGPVSLNDIASIDIAVTGVQALPIGAGEAEADSAAGEAEEKAGQGAWVSLDVVAASKINLLALPSAVESGLQLARGELAPGTYGNLRILFSEASITFARDVRVGGGPMAKTFAAGQAYPLQIGGGKLRVPTGGFTVAEDGGGTVVVTFDGSASVRTVVATPVVVRMAPVLVGAQGDAEGERGGRGKGKG